MIVDRLLRPRFWATGLRGPSLSLRPVRALGSVATPTSTFHSATGGESLRPRLWAPGLRGPSLSLRPVRALGSVATPTSTFHSATGGESPQAGGGRTWSQWARTSLPPILVIGLGTFTLATLALREQRRQIMGDVLERRHAMESLLLTELAEERQRSRVHDEKVIALLQKHQTQLDGILGTGRARVSETLPTPTNP